MDQDTDQHLRELQSQYLDFLDDEVRIYIELTIENQLIPYFFY